MDQFSLLLAALSGLASSAVIGFVKGIEERVDTKIVSKLGNLTPILVIALSVALPKLWVALHLVGAVPDAQIFASAPIATIIAILSREAMVKLKAGPTP